MKILGVDLGLVRTGIAVSDERQFLASPVSTIEERNSDRLVEKICLIYREQNAKAIVVGYPKNMDGSCGESAQRAESIADKLRMQLGCEVVLWDERLTTVSAIGYLNETNVRGKKRKQVVDTVAATIILQNYLDSLPSLQ